MGVGIRVGTASWTDRTLVEESDFYPRRSMSARERLRFYASRFDLVEVDATYYYPPTPELAGKWVERTPEDFVFDVKAYSLLTRHPTEPRSLWADVAADLPEEHRGKDTTYLDHLPEGAVARAFQRFREALEPLVSAGKLGAVFFQFPPWFRPSRASRRYLEQVRERMDGIDVAVEFRHSSWMHDADRSLGLLRDLGLAYTVVDEPQGFDSSVPPVVAATTDRLAVVRFHGHNDENWERPGISAAERFRYLYSEDELEAWVPRVRELADSVRETHVLFNNCYRDYGVRNARQLAGLLGVARDAGA